MGLGEQSSGFMGAGTEGSLLAFLRVLATDPDGPTLATALARGLLSEWSPVQVVVFLVDPTGELLAAAASFGSDPLPTADHSLVPVDLSTPFTHVFRTGEESEWTLAESAELFPAVAGWVASHPSADTAEAFGLPLRSGGRTVGVLGVVFGTPVERSWRLRSALDGAVAALSVWALAPGRSIADAERLRGVTPTSRQRRILQLLEAGRSNAKIAAELGVSVGTVKTDLAHLFRLYGVRDRKALVHAARRAEATLHDGPDGHVDATVDARA